MAEREKAHAYGVSAQVIATSRNNTGHLYLYPVQLVARLFPFVTFTHSGEEETWARVKYSRAASRAAPIQYTLEQGIY